MLCGGDEVQSNRRQKKEEGREHNNMKKEEAQAKAPQYCPILTIV
jgi:hypothetical protein